MIPSVDVTRTALVVLVLGCLASLSESAADHNNTYLEYKPYLNSRGETVYMTEELRARLQEEAETWHWMPWLPTRTQRAGDVVYKVECQGNSVESFPNGIFDDVQLRSGGFILYAIFGIYAFILLAFVCDDFFIPTVEILCVKLNIPQNVAAATFMSVATSCPEFFVNVISTFVTESDMGIGTIVGSALFNALGVAAIGGLAASKAIKIDSLPVTRDVLIYSFNVGMLVIIVWDGVISWVEAMILQILYIFYFVIMFNSPRIFALFGRMCFKTWFSGAKDPESDSNDVSESDEKPVVNGNSTDKAKDESADSIEPTQSIWRFPREEKIAYQIWWLMTWPLRFVLGMTIPSPVKYPKFYPLTFLMCIIWIGVNSYFVTWSMTVIGHTFFIPDSVMGMTFLAFGGCLPEACSIFIMSRRGEGGIGVSNALGANSLAILFALGMPWLIKTLTLVSQGDENPVIYINSAGIDFVVGSIIVAVACLWIVLFIGKFTLRKVVGAALLVLYVIFVTFAILVEMGIIIDTGIVLC